MVKKGTRGQGISASKSAISNPPHRRGAINEPWRAGADSLQGMNVMSTRPDVERYAST